MYITLNLTKEGKLELSLETQRHVSNPRWVVEWIDQNMSSSYERAGFSFIDGSVTFKEGKEIVFFLEELAKRPSDISTSTKDNQTSQSISSSLAIQSVEQVKQLIPKIRNLHVIDNITQEDFKFLSESINTNNVVNNLDSKAKFIQEYNNSLNQVAGVGRFFAPLCQKTSFDNCSLSDIVRDAREETSTARTVFVKLGWMEADGTLTQDVPTDVADEYNTLDNIAPQQAG
ncbi:hypothetical protein ACNVED_03410 [Legionella sp. D16C41]|uniref:hypothetical protein n=1 Tax=Legionella sp. D16C41 TaxID=3402688 RepID=UPI003AF956B7